jgi:hypothetical protein
MYLVELRPGKEELYRSSDELAVAIRNGDVDARSRVYHRATAKWISITLHPQYKAIVAAAKDDPVGRPARRAWGILGGGGGQAAESSGADASPSNGHVLHRWRRPLAFGLSGLLLISGIQLAFSGPRPPWAGRPRVAAADVRMGKAARAETPVQAKAGSVPVMSLASTKTVWSVPPSLPRAPRLRSKSLREALTPGSAKAVDPGSLDALFARYAAAHDSARIRLEAGIRVARLGRLFAAPRLSASGGVTDTRMSLAGAANFIRVFRQQQTMIEAAYQDSVTMLAKRNGWAPRRVRQWYARPSPKEAPSLELLSGSLLASIDSVLGLLDGHAGAYKIRGSAIAFEEPTAGQTYGALRRRIKEQVDAAIAAGGATSSGPTGLLLRAIATTTLPRET